jgi:WD40 repeat protein
MNINLNAVTRTVLTITGAALIGPVGTVLGGFLGGLTGSALPFVTEVIKSLSSVATRESLITVTKKTISRIPPNEKERLNHDLQTAFRDALMEGLHDIGGPLCFPQVWKSQHRQIPEDVLYSRCHPSKKDLAVGDLLTSQVCDCLRALEQAVLQEEILAFEPPTDQLSAQAQTYLQAETPDALNTVFFDQNIRPVLSRYQSLLNEVTDLEPHLRLHLLDRTLLHLGELLKHRTDAWRAYNRLSLESLRDVVNQVSEGQNDLLARLDELLSNPQGPGLTAWSESMADLLSATGGMEKKLDVGFDALTERVIAQHREVLLRLDELAAGTSRIESKVDRMLRFLDNGSYVIDSQMTVPLRKPPAAGEAPFKGLEYFNEADSALFYGRDRLIAAIVERLGQCTFLAVVGASGSGKSSLVRAGLVPVLQGKRILSRSPLLPVGCADWPVHIITPTEQPFLALAASFAPQGAGLGAVRKLAGDLRGDPGGLDLAVRRLLAMDRTSKRVLLVVDQFEEIFTLCADMEEQRRFVEALLQAGRPHGRGSLVLVIILRADFYAHCAQFEGLREAVSSYQEYIGPMNREELRQAIEEPAQRNGWKFEPGIVDLLIHDAGEEPGALPLLSHALLETWKNRSGHTMTLESYAESGGVRRAIAKTAEAVYKRLTSQQALTARSLLLRMIQPGSDAQDTRRRVSLEELRPQAAQAAQTDEVLRQLTEARLVTVDEGYAQVAHEALIREWPTLRQWLEEDRQGLRIQRKTTEAAQEWERLQGDEGLLFRGARLAEIQEWAAAHVELINPLEREFIDRSAALAEREANERETQRQRELQAAQRLAEVERERAEAQTRTSARLRRGAIGLGAALLVAAAFAGISLVFANQAQSNARQARSGQLAAQALNLVEQYPQRALLLALEAVQMGKENDLALDALYQSLTRTGGLPLIQTDQSLEVAVYAPWTDHPWLAAAGNGGVIYLWDLTLPEWTPATLTLETQAVLGLAFSPGTSQQGFKRWLAAADEEGRVVVWDMQDLPAGSQTLQKDGTPVIALSFSPATADAGYGKWLVAVNDDGQVLAWDANDWDAGARVLVQGDQSLSSLAFSADGRQLVTGDWNGVVRLYEVSPGTIEVTQKQEFSHHVLTVFAVAISPDGKWLASGSVDNSVILQNLADPYDTPHILTGYHDQVYALAFTPDSSWLAIGSEGDNLRFWNVDQPIIPPFSLHGHENTVYGLAFSPDGKWLFSASLDGSARLWPSPVARKTTLIPQTLGGLDFPLVLRDHSDWVLGLAYSPDGQWLASAGADNKIVLHDPRKLEKSTQILTGKGLFAYSLAFSPDNKWLAAGDADTKIYLWNMNGLSEPLTLTGHNDWVQSLAFSPDGKWLASGSNDSTIRLWLMEDLSTPPQVLTPGREVLAMAFSPDSQLLAAGVNDQVWIYEIKDTSQAPVKLRGHTNFVSALAFSRDGRKLASGGWDNTLRLWDRGNWQAEPVILQGHADRINGLAFDPDGKWLASASADGTGRLWNLTRLDASPLVLGGYEDEVQSLAFSPDGKWLAAASLDGTVRLWTMDVEQIQALACRKVGRSLTSAEWQLYFPDETYRGTCP